MLKWNHGYCVAWYFYSCSPSVSASASVFFLHQVHHHRHYIFAIATITIFVTTAIVFDCKCYQPEMTSNKCFAAALHICFTLTKQWQRAICNMNENRTVRQHHIAIPYMEHSFAHVRFSEKHDMHLRAF